MSATSINTNQHYVPQMLLRGFEIEPGSEQVWAFDKRTDKAFITTVRNIAAERGYYDLGENATIDDVMTRADDMTFPIIDSIRQRRSVSRLSGQDRGLLAGFVVLQFLRTRGMQEKMRNLEETVAARVHEMTGQFPEKWEEEGQPEKQREHYLQTIREFTQDFLPHLLNKNLILYETDRNAPFCCSDDPVAMTNTINPGDGLRGTIGLAVPGIEIHLPISSEFSLAYTCPTIGAAFEAMQQNYRSHGGLFLEEAFCYLRARDFGLSMKLQPENVRFHNSLQIINAERFVIASRNDFADAADIVVGDPKVRTGRRFGMN